MLIRRPNRLAARCIWCVTAHSLEDRWIPPLVGRNGTLGAAQSDAVERARTGDRAAFEMLVRSRVDRLHRTACAILGNEADAYDATQDAFLSAWQQLPRLRDVEAFDAWLTRIIVNACRMRLRARRAVREVQAVEPGADGEPAYATRERADGRPRGRDRRQRAPDAGVRAAHGRPADGPGALPPAPLPGRRGRPPARRAPKAPSNGGCRRRERALQHELEVEDRG